MPKLTLIHTRMMMPVTPNAMMILCLPVQDNMVQASSRMERKMDASRKGFNTWKSGSEGEKYLRRKVSPMQRIRAMNRTITETLDQVTARFMVAENGT